MTDDAAPHAAARPQDADAGSDTSLATRTGLPASAAWLRDAFAAEPWREHPNYAGLAEFWQQVHRGIRAEGTALGSLLDRARNEAFDPALLERELPARLRQYLGHLDFHHRIEDQTYFPRFRTLDTRLVAGFDLLETDHRIIHERLEQVSDSGRALLRSLGSPAGETSRHLETHAAAAAALVRLLDRHLDDEEDLVIPVILRHGDRAAA